MNAVLYSLLSVWCVSLALFGWTYYTMRRAARRRAESASFRQHVAEALAVVDVEQCEAVVDRRPRRLPDPQRCPHLADGMPAYASVRWGGDMVQVCSDCWVVRTRQVYELGALDRDGIPAEWLS